MQRPGDKYKKLSGDRNKYVYNITTFDAEDKKKDRISVFMLLGAFCFVFGLVSLYTSFEERKKCADWQEAPQLREWGDWRAIGLGNEVTLSGSIAPETPASDEGLALYETWEYKRSGKHKKWKRVDDFKPDWELLLGSHSVVIQSKDADFHRTIEIKLDSDTRLEGFAPGDEVFVIGTVASTDGARVQASVLCGGDREQCLGHISKDATTALLQSAAAALLGLGLIAFDLIARKKSQ